MSATVTLHVFSGRPNPRWILSDEQSAELSNKVDAISATTNLKPIGPYGGLGYHGFSIQYHDSPRTLFVHAGLADIGPSAATLISDDRAVEQWLYSTGLNAIPPEAIDHIKDSISTPAQEAQKLLTSAVVAPACPVCKAASAPAYNPAMWNTPAVQPHNNCYNYANDKITNTFAQPGRAHGVTITALACGNVQPAAIADGLTPCPNFTAPLAAGSGSYVALVIWPGADFHWYRQDRVGCWSHKPGSTAVRNLDNAGRPIADPQTCNRGPYTNFCTYMVTKSTVIIS